MSKRLFTLNMLFSGLLMPMFALAQYDQGYGYGPPPPPGGCSSCQTGGPSYPDNGSWNGNEAYMEDYGNDYQSEGYCETGQTEFQGGFRRRPLRNLAARTLAQPDCADCNWGPVYMSLFGGGAFIDNLDTRNTFNNGVAGMLGIEEIGFSTLDGVAAGGSIGRYFYRQARAEVEYTFRENGVGDMNRFIFSDVLSTPRINDTLVSSTRQAAAGNIESNSYMFNLVFDLKPRTVGCMNAYLGGGVGALYVDGDANTATETFNMDDSAFAFQGIAGINYPIRERVDLFTEYRYLGVDAISVTRTNLAGTENLGTFRFDSHNVVFGLRFLR